MYIHEAILFAVAQPYRLRRGRDPGDIQSRRNSNQRGTYQEHGRRDLNLTFWSEDGDYIGGSFLVGESNPAIGFVFNVVNEDTFVPK
jgi:hypothetical protein